MRIRPTQPADHARVAEIVTTAFGDEGPLVSSLVSRLRQTGHVRAALVAEDETGVIGHVQLNRSWLDARRRLVEVLVLSPLSVAPTAQRRGVGTDLLAAALAEAERLGAPAVFVEGGWGYYGKRGFGRASLQGFTAPSDRIPDPAFQVALLPALEPWMTGALVYCEAFWALDCVGLRDPLLGQIEATLDASQ